MLQATVARSNGTTLSLVDTQEVLPTFALSMSFYSEETFDYVLWNAIRELIDENGESVLDQLFSVQPTGAPFFWEGEITIETYLRILKVVAETTEQIINED